MDTGSNEVVLTRDDSGQTGAAWFGMTVDLARPIDVRFRIYLGNNDRGANGLAFVFHRDPHGLDALGAFGDGLGARGLDPAVFIEFDTFDNTKFGDLYELDCDHTAVFTGAYHPIVLPRCLDQDYYAAYDVEDGRFHDVRISWTPGILPKLNVSFDDNEIISLKEDIVAEYFGGDPRNIYLGMTAGTGELANEHKFCLPEQIAIQGT